jgi:hypothetical protein
LATRYESKLRDLRKFDYSNRSACLACPLKSRCTKEYRKVSRLENEAVLDRMAARLKVRIPTQAGRGYRFEAGQGSDLMPATIPR